MAEHAGLPINKPGRPLAAPLVSMNMNDSLKALSLCDVREVTVFRLRLFLTIARALSLGQDPTMRDIAHLMDIAEGNIGRAAHEIAGNPRTNRERKSLIKWIHIQPLVEGSRHHGVCFQLTDRGKTVARAFGVKV